MSSGDIPIKVPPTANYKSDDSSSSSESLFNRQSIPIVSSSKINTEFISTLSEQTPLIEKVINDEHAFKLNSYVRCLEDKINNQNANLHHQQSEITNLRKIIADLSNQFYQLKSEVNSPTHSPISHSRPNSILCVPQSNHTCVASPARMKSFDYFDASNGVEHFRNFQDVLNKTTAALERRDIENQLLKQQLDDIRCIRPLADQNSCNASTPTLPIPPPSLQHSSTSAFTPIVTSSKPTSFAVPGSTFNTTSIMPFTMSLTNTLPNFSGKETEMPTKFITEFEIRASGLVGYNDDYLLRAVQQVLSDSALTWFIQIQQEQPIHTWAQFKLLFLRRFRTPEKIELLRGRLRTLWQGDNEATADYFERLKALISEIEPETSIDYIKRKFLQKLRKDIRDKMTLGLTSTLAELVRKASEIESNIIQQKVDDKLRAAHKEENKNKNQSDIINNLFNAPRINSSKLLPVNTHDSYDHSDNNYNYNNNRNSPDKKYSRTFINSSRSSPRTTQIQNESSTSRSIANQNTNVKRRNNTRWCSFCSSLSHTWFHCYSNPKGPNYKSERDRPVQQYQQQRPQQLISPSDYSQQQHSDQHHHYQSSNQNTNINQRHYQQPVSSNSTSQRSPIPENYQGSRY